MMSLRLARSAISNNQPRCPRPDPGTRFPFIPFCLYSNRPVNTSSTAYPSGSVKYPTQIIVPSSSSSQVNQAEKSRTVPESHRKLPDLPSRKPLYISTFVIISSIWATFIYFSTNAEKANSSVVKAILFELRNNSKIQAALGSSLKPLKDDLFGQLWVDGQISLMQGSVDVAFRVTGSENSGKVYFTSVRRDRNSEFEIIRWKLIRDDGLVIDLVNENSGPILLTGSDNDQDKLVIIGTLSPFNKPNHRSEDHDLATPTESHNAVRLV